MVCRASIRAFTSGGARPIHLARIPAMARLHKTLAHIRRYPDGLGCCPRRCGTQVPAPQPHGRWRAQAQWRSRDERPIPPCAPSALRCADSVGLGMVSCPWRVAHVALCYSAWRSLELQIVHGGEAVVTAVSGIPRIPITHLETHTLHLLGRPNPSFPWKRLTPRRVWPT